MDVQAVLARVTPYGSAGGGEPPATTHITQLVLRRRSLHLGSSRSEILREDL